MTKALSLGPLPRTDTVKLTIIMTSQLRADLDRYAALHAQLHGSPVDATTLAPLIIEAFLARDKGFRRATAAERGRRTTLLNEARQLDEKR